MVSSEAELVIAAIVLVLKRIYVVIKGMVEGIEVVVSAPYTV